MQRLLPGPLHLCPHLSEPCHSTWYDEARVSYQELERLLQNQLPLQPGLHRYRHQPLRSYESYENAFHAWGFPQGPRRLNETASATNEPGRVARQVLEKREPGTQVAGTAMTLQALKVPKRHSQWSQFSICEGTVPHRASPRPRPLGAEILTVTADRGRNVGA